MVPVPNQDNAVSIEQNIQKTRSFNAKRLLLLVSYFSVVPLFVVFVTLFSLSMKYEVGGQFSRQEHRPQFQALPSDGATSSIAVENHDARIQSLEEFFTDYNSPLAEYSGLIVSEADKHSIDYRLLPAIAMQESTLCKKIIKDSHNCWGFGIYGGKVTKFEDYGEAIKTITSTLSKKYVKLGFDHPDEIVQKYTPSDTGRWADTVKLIMSRLKESI